MTGTDYRKPRRDRIAREAEETAKRHADWEARGEQAIEKWSPFRSAMKGLVREYFDFRNGGRYPCEETLVDLLDTVRLEFFELQKEVGVGGHSAGNHLVPDDPKFGTQGDRQPRGNSEQAAVKAYKEGTGVKPPFLLRTPDDA